MESTTETASTITDLLDELAGAMEGAKLRQQEVDAFMAKFEPAFELAKHNDRIKTLRNCVEELLRTDGLKTVSTNRVRATMVTRHDYVIEDAHAFVERASADGKVESWRVWDMTAIKKFASSFRKEHDANYPGIVDVPKSWLEVTPL